MRRTQQPGDSGFTLIELGVTTMIFGLLIAIAVGPWRSYQRRQDHVGTTREVVALFRNAQVASVAENQTYRIDVATRELKVYRFDGTSYRQVRSFVPSQRKVSFAGATFTSSSGTGSSVYFFPRGSASRGRVQVVLEGKEDVYTIDVEGLTARVSYR